MSTPRAPAPSQPGDDGDRSSESVTVRRVEFPSLSDTTREAEPLPTAILGDVEVVVDAVLGASRLTVRDILAMRPGSLIGLDRIAGQSVEMRANNVPIAAGEVIVVDDQYAVRITSIGNRREQQSSRQPDQPGEDLQDEPAED